MVSSLSAAPGGRLKRCLSSPSAACILLSLLAVLIYAPGLRGGLYLDDFYNLHLLERVSADGYASFIFSGQAGPFGRPLSLLSFAWQHASWPDALVHFKVVNLLIHLLDGALVFLIARRLAGSQPLSAGAAHAVALLTAGLWLLHPMQMSTVLYIVQRMAQLSTLFILLGLYGYLLGRELCASGKLRAGYFLMTLSIAAGTLLAVLSKENGILLPLLVLITDCTLLRSASRPPGYSTWRLPVLVLPAVLPAAYLIWTLPEASRSFADLPYSMAQKAMTEAVVLVQYLARLLLPSPGAFGLYHDDFQVSRGLLDPPWTLAAILAILALVAAGAGFRRRCAVASFGILWFFGSHLLESTHLNLVLYFEHRNYVASFGVFLLLSWTVVGFIGRSAARRTLWIGAAAAYAVLIAGVTAQNSLLWSDRFLQASEAVRTHPASIWARAELGNEYLGLGRTAEAMALFRQMESQHPELAYARLKQMAIAGCVQDQAMSEAWWRRTMELASRSTARGSEVLGELDTVIWTLQWGECRVVDTARLRDWIEVLAGNGANRREKGGLLELAASLCLQRNEPERALANLTGAIRASPTSNRQLRRIELLAAMGRTDEARTALGLLDGELRGRPLERLGYAGRIEALRRRLGEAGAGASAEEESSPEQITSGGN